MTDNHNDGLLIEQSGDLTAEDYRRTLGHFCSGITIVTAAIGEERIGMTCQSFFAVSLEPPLVAFSPSKASRSYPRIRDAGAFCINVLAEHQQELCGNFARSGADKWANVGWRPEITGSPVLDDVLAWIDCDLAAEHDAGDHWLVIGRVRALQETNRRPLLYFQSRFARLA